MEGVSEVRGGGEVARTRTYRRGRAEARAARARKSRRDLRKTMSTLRRACSATRTKLPALACTTDAGTARADRRACVGDGC